MFIFLSCWEHKLLRQFQHDTYELVERRAARGILEGLGKGRENEEKSALVMNFAWFENKTMDDEFYQFYQILLGECFA